MLTRRTFLAACAAPILQGQPGPGGSEMFADAKAYERFMGRWSRLVAPLLVDFAALPDRGKVLDVGSGTGALAFAIARRRNNVDIVGIDPSKEYVAFANSENRVAHRIHFEVGDAQNLRIENTAFAAAVSLLVFNFIPDPAKALRELHRIVRPEGSITAAVWDYGGRMRMLRAFWDAAVHLDQNAAKLDERNMPLCRTGELAALWKHGGLENISEKPLDITTRFSSFADYWDAFLLGQGPAGAYVKTLDASHKQALRDTVKRQLKLTGERAPFTLPARVWAVRGIVPAR